MKTSTNNTCSLAPIVVGVATLIICVAGIAFLAFALINTMQGPAWKDNANQPVHTVVQEESETDVEDSYSPLRLVDTRGMELPDDCVSAGEAFAITTTIAKTVFRTMPYARAYALLRSDGYISHDYYDTASDLFWDVTMETDYGLVETWIDARSGLDTYASFTPSSSVAHDYWDFFDAWAESGSESEPSGQFGTIADEQAVRDRDLPHVDEAAHKRRNQIQRELVAELAEIPAALHAAETAVYVVNERGMGDGAEAVSAMTCMEADGGMYVVDVELDNGAHLFLHVYQESPDNIRVYERHNTNLLDLVYPL